MKTETLYKTGFTEDNKLLIGGVLRMYTERGLPVADSIKEILESDCRFCMIDYIFDALGEDWDDEKIASSLYEAYRDAGIGCPPYDLVAVIEKVIIKEWDEKESFKALGKRMIKQFRT
jgi:hypothetical protein